MGLGVTLHWPDGQLVANCLLTVNLAKKFGHRPSPFHSGGLFDLAKVIIIFCKVKICGKIYFSTSTFQIWFPKKKTITYFWSKLSKLHKKDPILHVVIIYIDTQNKPWTAFHTPKDYGYKAWRKAENTEKSRVMI